MSTKGYRKPGAKRAIVSIRLTEEELAAVDWVRGGATRGAVMKHNTMQSIMAEYQARVFVPSLGMDLGALTRGTG